MNREWQRDVDRDIRELMQRTAHLPSRIRGGGGSGGGAGVYKGATVADLPAANTVDNGSFGRVTSDTVEPIGSMWCISPDGTSWVSFTHFG